MILSDRMIKAAMEAGDIVIEPFDPKALGTNSYDVHLGPTLKTYASQHDHLDCALEHDTFDHVIPGYGFILEPNKLYLASTVEYTETREYVPCLSG